MNTTLYVIGNGFDIHHGIRSKYQEFAGFLKAIDPTTYGYVEEYFSVDDEFWSDFETRLADFDSEHLTEIASGFLESYGAEGWSDASHHDYQFEIDQAVKGLSTGLKALFGNWIRQLEIPHPATIPSTLLSLDGHAAFLNFNYTESLVKIYSVAASHVLHIHGSAADLDIDLVLGHGWNPVARGSSNDSLDLEELDTRVAAGNSIIDEYFELTFKPTDRVIASHRSFFDALRAI